MRNEEIIGYIVLLILLVYGLFLIYYNLKGKRRRKGDGTERERTET